MIGSITSPVKEGRKEGHTVLTEIKLKIPVQTIQTFKTDKTQ